ncbi:MAG: aminoacyl-tRNA hydrolase [Acidobacteriota bacterium]
MWVLVGLGNPGFLYRNTRHNVGFMCLKMFAKKWNVRLNEKKYYSYTGKIRLFNEEVSLVLPQTYMNNSGIAVEAILKGEKILPENLIVIYDDMDIQVGEIRIRKKGSAGAHKGVKSIIEKIGTDVFFRVRIGVGKSEKEAIRYVLSPFGKKEKKLIKKSLEKAIEAAELIIKKEEDFAMNKFNKRINPCSSYINEGL